MMRNKGAPYWIGWEEMVRTRSLCSVMTCAGGASLDFDAKE